MEAVIAQIDQRFLLGELMPFSDRLEDKLYRELIRQSNRSVIEKIHAAEEQKKDYRTNNCIYFICALRFLRL